MSENKLLLSRPRLQGLAASLPAFLIATLWAGAPTAEEQREIGYQEPPREVIDIVDAPRTPSVQPDPDRNWLLAAEPPALRTIADLAEPQERLAGIRMNPDNNGPDRPSYYIDLTLKPIEGGEAVSIDGLPEDPRMRNMRWSPDGEHVAFVNVESDRVALWVVDVEAAEARELDGFDLNAAFPNRPFEWHPDGDSLWVRKLPEERGERPEKSRVPTGPSVQESRGRTAPARTYQDLLENEHDEALFDYYFTGQLARVSLDGGLDSVGEAGVITSFGPSPDGDYLLVTTLRDPYSYTVPHFRFARTIDVRDESGEQVSRVVDRDLADDLPIAFDATVTGPRNVQWRADADAELVWVETQDGGDPGEDVDVREKVYAQPAPFDSEPRKLAELEKRFHDIKFADGETALVYERWFNTRRENLWRIAPDDPDRDQDHLWERSWEDRYNDPGSPLSRRDEQGHPRLVLRDGGLLLSGPGASDEGDRPFLDWMDLETGDTERLWQTRSPYYERVLGVIDENELEVLTRREQIDEPPNFYVRDLLEDRLSAITAFPHPMPELRDVTREMITYEREDGVSMSGQLYLPADYDAEEDGPLPTVVWAYPREFRSADAAGQISGSPYQFNRISYWNPQYLVTQGYAVIDRATMPVVGEGDEEPNDTFIEQLVMNAQAAVDAGAEKGVTDPDRVALGGHSYGAFMTANVMAHSDIFNAGIARSGAYNRSLTPFGFQREQRTVFEAPELYVRMSPFFHAHELKNPILLIHGAEDNNSGTYPMQSERFYNALQGLGGTARLVMLPEESHGYRARESVLHMLHEQLEWMNEFVRDAE